MNKVIIVQGGQYGSEAKGQIAGVICEREWVNIAVRTGATNAGHTYYVRGEAVKFQQLPVAAAIPGIQIVLGAGSLIDPHILDAEVQLASRLAGDDVRARLVVDPRAALHLPAHAERSAISGRHVAIGATGKGCSEALIDRIKGRSDKSYVLFGLFGKSPFTHDYNIADTEALLNQRFDEGAKILLEGTQGQGLDLYLGPYPYTTHKQCGPGQWMLECGLSPALPTDIVMVVRTYPIRVAGNSGPMTHEMSWPMMANIINNERKERDLPPIVNMAAVYEFEMAVKANAHKFALPVGSDGLDQHMWRESDRVLFRQALSDLNKVAMEQIGLPALAELKKLFEFTTVTKKLRRIAALDYKQLGDSGRQIRPHRLAITFMNYEFPMWWYKLPNGDYEHIAHYAYDVAMSCGVNPTRPIMLGWGPESRHVQTVDIASPPGRVAVDGWRDAAGR